MMKKVVSFICILFVITMTGCSLHLPINEKNQGSIPTAGVAGAEPFPKEKSAKGTSAAEKTTEVAGYKDGEKVHLDPQWEFADFSRINSGDAVMHRASSNRRNIVIGVNAGHGTNGGGSVKTYCHPDKTEKVTGGTTSAGNVKAIAVSSGMDFDDGTPESKVNLKVALKLKEILLQDGYDVLMIREESDVQLDNVARTVICNNAADCHIAIHFDGDGLNYDKGCYYMSVPSENNYKKMYPVSTIWSKSEELGNSLIQGLRNSGNKIWDSGNLDEDLTQTSFSKVPSVDIELGNQCSDHGDEKIEKLAEGLHQGIKIFFEK